MRCHCGSVLTRLYIEALLVDPDLADEVWELWNQGLISGEVAILCWGLMARVLVATPRSA